jgi:hypothetical protein
MPLNSPEDYERLGEHLTQIDSPLAEFAMRYGYIVYPKHSGGRYPNRRITQEGRLLRSITIQMDNTPKGERYDSFFPTIPYTIWGGAWIDDFARQTRWLGPSIRIEGIPFTSLIASLDLHLRHFHEYLSCLTESYILACGRSVHLGSPEIGSG